MIAALIVTMFFTLPLMLAAWTDFSSMKIPNEVSQIMAAGFFVTLPLHWQGLPMLGEHLMVGFAFFSFGFAMFAFGWLGGGDAKLMAAIALWLDWTDVMGFVFYVALFGAVLGLTLLFSKQLIPIRLQSSSFVLKMYQGGKDMPYGLALAAGSLFIWPHTAVFTTALG